MRISNSTHTVFMRLLAGFAGLVSLLSIVGCGVGRNNVKPMDVVVGFYSLAFIAEHIQGDSVNVTNLTPDGSLAQNLQLSHYQANRVADADLVLYLKGFQPGLDKAVKGYNHDRGYNIGAVQPLRPATVPANIQGELTKDALGKDPYVWLDPSRLSTIVDAVSTRYSQIQPILGKQYKKNGGKLRAQLQVLDREFVDGLANCRQHTIVVEHNAFGYLAERYGLNVISIAGIDPTVEPSTERLAEVKQTMVANKITTVFSTNRAEPKRADNLAKETGARIATLNSLETPPSQGDYFTHMRDNLQTLRTELQCS